MHPINLINKPYKTHLDPSHLTTLGQETRGAGRILQFWSPHGRAAVLSNLGSVIMTRLYFANKFRPRIDNKTIVCIY